MMSRKRFSARKKNRVHVDIPLVIKDQPINMMPTSSMDSTPSDDEILRNSLSSEILDFGQFCDTVLREHSQPTLQIYERHNYERHFRKLMSNPECKSVTCDQLAVDLWEKGTWKSIDDGKRMAKMISRSLDDITIDQVWNYIADQRVDYDRLIAYIRKSNHVAIDKVISASFDKDDEAVASNDSASHLDESKPSSTPARPGIGIARAIRFSMMPTGTVPTPKNNRVLSKMIGRVMALGNLTKVLKKKPQEKSSSERSSMYRTSEQDELSGGAKAKKSSVVVRQFSRPVSVDGDEWC
jgi:hypothetical protein